MKRKTKKTVEIEHQSNVKECWWDSDEKLFHCVMMDGSEWISTNPEKESEWKRISVIDTPSEERNEFTESQEKIVEICDAIKDLLLYKNKKYGDSALHPNNIFYKGDSTNSIKIRLDDKVGRIKNCEETRVNDVADVVGYSILLLASMNVTKEDIAKFKD